jgi:hypothetical protein
MLLHTIPSECANSVTSSGRQEAVLVALRECRSQAPPHAFDGPISLWLKYIVAADGRSADGSFEETDDAHLLAELR